MIVLVTGGKGSLGRLVLARLAERSVQIRAVTRGSPEPGAGGTPGVDWVAVDLESGAGLAAAIRGVETILHLATNPKNPAADLKQTRHLVTRARRSAVKRFVYVSIVGIDRMAFGYYRAKLKSEELVRDSGLGWLIVRSTQFHSLLDEYLTDLADLPLPALLPENEQFQTIDEAEVADLLVEATLGSETGYARQLAGPEKLTLGAMARGWEEVRGRRIQAVPLAVPEHATNSRTGGPAALVEAYRTALNVPGGQFRAGKVAWMDYLWRTNGSPRVAEAVAAQAPAGRARRSPRRPSSDEGPASKS